MALTKKQLELIKHILLEVKKKNQIDTGDIILGNTYYTNKEHNSLIKQIEEELKTIKPI